MFYHTHGNEFHSESFIPFRFHLFRRWNSDMQSLTIPVADEFLPEALLADL